MKKILLLSVLLLFPIILTANSQSQILVTKGLIALDEENYEKAEKIFNQAVTADVSDDEAIYYLGKTFMYKGDYEGAIRNFEKTDFPEKEIDEGMCYFYLGEYDNAILTFKKYIKKSKDPYGYYYLGVSYFKKKKYNTSKKYFLRAVKSDLTKATASIFLGLIYINEKKYEKAKKRLVEAVEFGDKEAKKKAKKYLKKLNALMEPDFAPGVDFGIGSEYDTNVFVLPDKKYSSTYNLPESQINNTASGAFSFWLKPEFNLFLNKKHSLSINSGLELNQKLYFNSEAQDYNLFSLNYNLGFVYTGTKFQISIPFTSDYYYLSHLQEKFSNTNSIGINFAYFIQKVMFLGGYGLKGEYFSYQNQKDTPMDREGLRNEFLFMIYYTPFKNFLIDGGVVPYSFKSSSNAPVNDWNQNGFDINFDLSYEYKCFKIGSSMNIEIARYADYNTILPVNATSQVKRKDTTSQFFLYSGFNFSKSFYLDLYMIYINNSSNIEAYGYKRTIGGFKLGLSF